MMRNLSYILIFLLAFGFAGCKGKGTQAQKPVAKKAVAQTPSAITTTAQAPSAITTTMAAQKGEMKVEKEVYNYDPKGRRDPFTALVDVSKEKPKRKKGLTPIENFDVDEIKLLAIAWDAKQAYAMISLPDKKTYAIKKGMTLGLYGGKVEEIAKTYVLIREQIKDYKGQLKTKDTILKLRKEGEE